MKAPKGNFPARSGRGRRNQALSPKRPGRDSETLLPAAVNQEIALAQKDGRRFIINENRAVSLQGYRPCVLR